MLLYNENIINIKKNILKTQSSTLSCAQSKKWRSTLLKPNSTLSRIEPDAIA